MENDKQKVIVIGAGFSGLSAAYHIHKQGVEVVVLEARNKVRGRVYSNASLSGTMNRALVTGETAAKEIINQTTKTP